MNMNRVGIFWDYENCAPPSGTPGYVVAERVRATCGVYGSVTQFRAYLELSAPPPAGSSQLANTELNPNGPCPPTSPKTLSLRSELQSSGVSLIDCPHNSRKNVADSMLACDLVCFALDNPTSQIPYANHLPVSSYSIPNTPFSAICPTSIPTSKTTIVLISGDRDFAYPLAVLKARKYEVGLIVPPGGAHPALRAQATWVMNWKDILEGGHMADGGQDSTIGTSSRGRVDNMCVDSPNSGVTPPSQGARRSFVPRRGSISGSRRGSVSISPIPVPPPPHLSTTIGSSAASNSFGGLGAHEGASNSFISNNSLIESLSTSQLLSTSRPSRKSPLRRPAAKAAARPPSRSKSRIGARTGNLERTEQEAPRSFKLEQPRPQPLIVPVPLTASPIGSAGPSLAGMSPRAGRPQTPPLFSTNPASPPPPAAPPALPSSTTPPIKTSTPPAKPSTPPKDVLRLPHRPSIPHVATPRPPIPEPYQPVAPGISSPKEQRVDETVPATLVVPTPKPSTNVLQSLLPAAAVLRPVVSSPTRPALAVPPSIQTSNTSTLAPATPVTPPASPPFRWARLQPVHDDTDGDVDRSSTNEKKSKAGKEKSKEKGHPVNVVSETRLLANSREVMGSNSKKNSMKLALEVGMLIGCNEEPSAVSGVDSILRSYTERSPRVERDNQNHHSLGDGCSSSEDPVGQKGGAHAPLDSTVDDDDEEEEQFHETFLATFSRPVCSNAPRTPATVKLVSLELTSEENCEGAVEHKKPRVTTPRPIARTSHSLPLIPMMQSLLAGVEGGQPISGNYSDVAGTLPQLEIPRHETAAGVGDRPQYLYSRANSPTPIVAPALQRRKTTPSAISEDFSDGAFDPLLSATYREFQFLISVLERCRRTGQERPLRSLIGAEFTRDVFEQAKATSFKDHVQRAVAAGVVSVGDGPVQGREWISLNGNWKGFGLVLD
ncbi:unnamed protein product [Rhizoctonia solani]|uniref:NYN domain-containing protein n=2 Tax=Rhizoctonia solani TaxID=456999 RepID=A0A8H3CB63_9AGAM|nr:unnamed protein product [Rhizoctonia solani]